MCKSCEYMHPHTHTEYSALDGQGKIEELIQRAVEHKQEHLAITDHGSMSGLWQAQKLGDKYGIHIVHGCEFYYERENDRKNGHLVVLAKNNKGLENMFKMQEIAYVENFYKKPRINWEILKEHSEGLIVTSSCLASTFCQHIMNGELAEAKKWAKKFQELFGEDFYIEVQSNMLREQAIVNMQGERIAKQLGIKLVASNDVHYTLEDDCFPHEVMLAMQVKKKLSDENRFKFDTNDFWFKSTEEMARTLKETNSLSDEAICEAMSTTVEIAEKCTARIEKKEYLAGYHAIPKGMDADDLLLEETMEGIERRGLKDNKEFIKEAKKELKVISESGYSDYFLTVQDMIRSARERGALVGPGRGSVGGSKVAYATGISETPPHKYGLLFERFLAPNRVPDIDSDFEDIDAVFDDLVEKYGENSVARIVAFGTLAPKAVIRKVFSVFGHDMQTIKRVTSQVPNLIGSIPEALKANPYLENELNKFPREFKVIKRLDGIVSHESQHSGGVLVYPDIGKYLPVKTLRAEPRKRIATWDKYMLEDIGFQKIDVLGLKTLPILNNAIELIRENEGSEIKLPDSEFDDEKVYEMLCEGDVSGVFQLESQSAKVVEQKPKNFIDLIAINALIRPGTGDYNEYIARRNGKPYEIYEPRKPHMEETLGTLTYQEQFILDAKVLAGWDLGYGDKNIRKNKDIANDVELKEKFYKDSLNNGHPEEVIKEVWEEIVQTVSGNYSFNKSHSTSYAILSYQSAWLKAKYPKYFYCALMSAEGTDKDGQAELSKLIAELKQRGVRILPPNINISTERFEPTKEGINYRITAIKSVGESAIEEIMENRPFSSFQDFLERKGKINKTVTINLIKAGAFDEFNPKREELMWEYAMSQRTKTQIKNDFQVDKIEVNEDSYMTWEFEVLGLYLSRHPMDKYGFEPFDSFEDGETALIGGKVVDRHAFNDKNGNEMAFITLDTLFGSIKVVCFSRDWTVEKALMAQIGNKIMVRGRKQGKDVLANYMEVLE